MTTVYHSSDSSQFIFDISKSKEIGLHCGTKEQAKALRQKYLYQLVVDTSKMCFLKKDITSTYGSLDFLYALFHAKIITEETKNKCINEIRKAGFIGHGSASEFAYSNYYRNLLQSLGFTGFIYPNAIEGAGNSICIIDKNIIQDIQPVLETFDYDSKSTTLVEEFKEYEKLWEDINKKFLIRFGLLNYMDKLDYKEVWITDSSFENAKQKIYNKYKKKYVRDITLVRTEDISSI